MLANLVRKDGGKITSNLASDKYQSMFVLGTSSGMLKIFSLKGYELEVHDAHDHEIIKVGLVPNKGLLVSIDSNNILKLWRLEDLDDCEI
jgi:WD40 repeat protein